MTRILIVDDHSIVRLSLRMYLEEEPDLSVCGEAATAHEALAMTDQLKPDLVLLDVSLPDMSGIELARKLHEQHPALRLAMLSGHGEKSHVEEALKAGATAYVMKGNAEEIAPAIRQTLRGQRYVSGSIADALGDR